MSKFTEDLKMIGIYNEHNFAGYGNPFISYEKGHSVITSRWKIVKPGFSTDKNSAWYDNGNKTFTCWRKSEEDEGFIKAKEWASLRYGVTEWAKTPYGSYMCARFLKARKEELKQAIKNAKHEQVSTKNSKS